MKVPMSGDSQTTAIELTYRELVVYATKYISSKRCDLISRNVQEEAHDITTDFLYSKSYKETFDSSKGDLLAFFNRYVFKKLHKRLIYHQKDRGKRVYMPGIQDDDSDAPVGITCSRDGHKYFIRCLEDFGGSDGGGGCREQKVEIKSVIEHVERVLGDRVYCGVKLLDVLCTLIKVGLDSNGKVRLNVCAREFGVNSKKARVLTTKVINISRRCYYA